MTKTEGWLEISNKASDIYCDVPRIQAIAEDICRYFDGEQPDFCGYDHTRKHSEVLMILLSDLQKKVEQLDSTLAELNNLKTEAQA